jgi:hypothetical protein
MGNTKKYPEIRHVNAQIKQSNKIRKSQCYVMDKGSVSEKIPLLIREGIRTDSIIHAEKKENINFGKIRRQLHLIFDKIKYNQWNVAETTPSVVKSHWRNISGKRVQ